MDPIAFLSLRGFILIARVLVILLKGQGTVAQNIVDSYEQEVMGFFRSIANE